MEKLHIELQKYIDSYLEKVTASNAQQCINEFNEEWEKITPYSADKISEPQSKYGLALVIFSVANFELPNTNAKTIKRLSELIEQYDTNKNVENMFGVKQSLFFNLGFCWHKLGVSFDSRAVKAFKKYVYYSIIQSNHTSYYPTAYAFRKCTTFLYQSLINEQLNLSTPTTFNDPFDCPIRVLLNKGEDIYPLVSQAYQQCLKIACFSSNFRLPDIKDCNSPSLIKKKPREDNEEYLNSLMWGHYADSHKGICIKYRFPNSISQSGYENPNIVAYFKDVKYSNGDMSKYSNKNTITLEDAFFLKGKEWEYENELRFLYYDLNGKGDYGTIDIPNCIEAIYFGLKCSAQDKETIQKIMQSKQFIQKDLDGTKPIRFYQMELDDKHFGRLKAVEL